MSHFFWWVKMGERVGQGVFRSPKNIYVLAVDWTPGNVIPENT